MKRVIQASMILAVSFVLAACGFPSQRLMKIDNCYDLLTGEESGNCGRGIVPNSELALVKETRGDDWRLWHKPPAGKMEEICTGSIDDDTFECPRSDCNPNKTIEVKERRASFCEYEQCVKLTVEGGNGCPAGGTGKGGSNDD